MGNSNFLNQVVLQFQEQFQPFHEDLSAVLLTPDKHLWLGSDETTTLERLSFDGSRTFSNHQHIDIREFIELPAAQHEEIDIEGLAYAGHYLWFVGSHSWKRKKPKPKKTDIENIERLTKLESEANRYILGRIPLIDGELLPSCPHPENQNEQLSSAKLYLTHRGNLLMDALASDLHLGAFVEATIPGKENGFDIEGLAIYQNRIFLGLRGPVLRGWAVMLEIELEDIGLGRLLLKKVGQKKPYKKHFIYLNGLGIRDLCWDGEDLLILAGPTMDLDGPVRVYRLKDSLNLQENVLFKPDIVIEIPYGNSEDHAEGMTLFTSTQKPSVMVVYDSPAQSRLQGDSDVIVDVFELG